MSRAYWAYGIKYKQATLVRCATAEDALDERERLKHSDYTIVGSVSRKLDLRTMRKAMTDSGWVVVCVRDMTDSGWVITCIRGDVCD